MDLLSVIIPAYNEESRIGSSLERISRYFTNRGLQFEIIVISDGSTDGTVELVKQFSGEGNHRPVKILENPGNRGKGYSVRRGMLAAEGEYALMTDADLSTPIEEFSKLEDPVIHGPYALAFGSRDVEGARVEIHQSWTRENSGKIFNRVVRLLTGLPFKDTQCGFKLFEMRRCRNLFEQQQTERFGFDVELLTIARRKRLSALEVPIVWRHEPGSKISLARDGWRMLWDTVRVRYWEIRGRYDSTPAAGPEP